MKSTTSIGVESGKINAAQNFECLRAIDARGLFQLFRKSFDVLPHEKNAERRDDKGQGKGEVGIDPTKHDDLTIERDHYNMRRHHQHAEHTREDQALKAKLPPHRSE